MAYPTICAECLASDHQHCEATIKVDRERVARYNATVPDRDVLVGGAFCVCGHGAKETAFQQSIRQQVEASLM